MSRLLFAKGARGAAIEEIQGGLHFDPRDVDGWYGNQTRDAVAAFQASTGAQATGQVHDVTWDALLHKPIPALFDRCLGVTAVFEGHGFSLAQGNFDGAGITWGIIGFTLKHGELARIILTIQDQRPDLVELAFQDQAGHLLDILQAPLADQIAFADSVSLGAKKVRLAEPWRSSFDLFGKYPEVRAEQLRHAKEDYFEPALNTADTLGLRTELGISLAFDIHVQNGGVKKGVRQSLLAMPPPASELDLRLRIANAVADSSKAPFREDVRTRKVAIAEGTGLVHGEFFDLANWGLADR